VSLPTTLAAFKRFLGNGGVITLRSFRDNGVEWRHKYKDVPRTAEVVQDNAVMLTPGDSWLYYGKAGQWTFDGAIARCTDELGGTLTYEMEVV
jgi:hypothetical protein